MGQAKRSEGEQSGAGVQPMPKGLRPASIMPDAGPAKVPYGKLFRWGWYVVSVAFGWFVVNTILSVFVQVLTQYNVQVLATVVSGLTGSSQSGSDVPAGAVSKSPGFLSGLLPTSIQTAAILFAVLAVVTILLGLLDRLLSTWTDNKMQGRLQQRLHDRLIALGPSYHQKHDLGETMLIVTRFSTGAQLLLRDLISSPVVRSISLVTALVFLANNMGTVGDAPFWIQGVLLAGLFVLPLGGWGLSRKVRRAFERVRDSETALANEFSNSASLPLEVQLMGAEKQRSEAFGARVRAHIRNKVAAALRNEVATQFQATTPVVLQTVFLIYGVFFALKSGNPHAPGAILAIYYFVPKAVSPLQEMIQFIMGLNSAWPQVEKVVEILDTEPEVKERPGAIDLSPEDQTVALENLTFSYVPNGQRVLDGLSYTFEAGKVTSIVAKAGGGKSTVLNLVARIRDPQAGCVRIGGKDIRDVTFASKRRQIAKVSQFPLFVADTIRVNLKLASADASDAELEAVCRRTGLWEVLGKAAGPGKQPLDYRLPRASSEGLSGGQRRLLAVTRSLLVRPAVLLLDEPTTGIDAIGRAMLAKVLRDACKGLTVLLVDHDMEFVAHVADSICCLENGKFVDIGSPQELSTRPSLFRSLLQASKQSSSGD